MEIRFFKYEVLLRQCPLLSNYVFDIFSWLSESKHRYVCIPIKCHILLFDPFVLAQSFQTLFLSFVPLYILSRHCVICKFGRYVLSFKLLIKNNVEYPELGERERGRQSQQAQKYSTGELFCQWHGFKILGERLFCKLKIFYYPVYIFSYYLTRDFTEGFFGVNM